MFEEERYINKSKKSLADLIVKLIGEDKVDTELRADIEEYAEAAISEAVDKGKDIGYREGLNEASYEYDRKMGYL